MTTVWKYELKMAEEQSIEMPDGAKILSAQMQAGQLMLWALVDTEHAKAGRMIGILGTGQPAAHWMNWPNARFISTVQITGSISVLVLHVFELLEE